MRSISMIPALRRAAAPVQRPREKRPRASAGEALHGAVAGALSGGLLGPALALLVARLSYGPFGFQDVAADLALRVGCSAGCLCGLLLGMVTPFIRPRLVGLLLAMGIGAAVGGIYAWTFGFSEPHVVPLGTAAGALDGLAALGAGSWLRKRWLGKRARDRAALQSGTLPKTLAPLETHLRNEAALRRRVVCIGRRALAIRFALPAVAAAAAVVFSNRPIIQAYRAVEVVILSPETLVYFLLGLPVSYALAFLYRRRALSHLRRQLAPHSREERAQMLLALDETPAPEIREVTGPLLRELIRARHREVAPAALPPGRGDEVTEA